MNLLSGVWIICLGQVLLQFTELRCNNTRQNRQIMSHKNIYREHNSEDLFKNIKWTCDYSTDLNKDQGSKYTTLYSNLIFIS